ncbi:MAG TPA: hypothetical protein PLV62_14490, partial [Spirochaetota bacterium]|nr:hypothetical protein [Spirochaetota bacterium]
LKIILLNCIYKRYNFIKTGEYMKKIIYLLLTAIMLCTVACFDVIHYIEPRNDKTVFIQFRVITGMVNNKELDDTFTKNNITKLYQGVNFAFTQISTDFKKGFELTATIKENQLKYYKDSATDNNLNTIIPYKDNKNQYILIYDNNEFQANKKDEELSSGLTDAVFSSINYKIIVAGSLKPKHVHLITYNESPKTMYLNPYKVGQQYFIEVPASLILQNLCAIIISSNNTIDDKDITAKLNKLYVKHKQEQQKREESLQNKDTEQQQDDESIDNSDKSNNMNDNTEESDDSYNNDSISPDDFNDYNENGIAE